MWSIERSFSLYKCTFLLRFNSGRRNLPRGFQMSSTADRDKYWKINYYSEGNQKKRLCPSKNFTHWKSCFSFHLSFCAYYNLSLMQRGQYFIITRIWRAVCLCEYVFGMGMCCLRSRCLKGITQQVCSLLSLEVLIFFHWPGLAQQEALKILCCLPVGTQETRAQTAAKHKQQASVVGLKNSKILLLWKSVKLSYIYTTGVSITFAVNYSH